ncbi:MAG: hypothetical protein R2733_11665 [Acidimicrobiales bacterium]
MATEAAFGRGVEDPIWNDVIGQPDAITRLDSAAIAPVHAYLFLGQQGVGTARAARSFAAVLLSRHLDGDASDRARRLAIAGNHPDLKEVRPEGAALRVDDAKEIIRHGQTSPAEGPRKVIVVHGVDNIEEAAIGRLLKMIEEPPPSAVFVLLAENVQPEIVTIASRCVTVEFSPIPTNVLEVSLISDGVPAERAHLAALASGGDLDRARLLSNDDRLAARAALWASVPDKLDGTGANVVELVNQVREGMDEAQAPLDLQQAREIEELDAKAEQLGERGLGRSSLVAQHKRQIKAIRNDELRFGLATMSRHYRDRLVAGSDPAAVDSIAAIQRAAEALVRNPNEQLLLQALFLQLG